MYPDPITPRAHPELLAAVDYDPFHVMPPATLPPAPRVFATAGQILRARQRLAAGSPVDKHCFEQLIKTCELDRPLPPLPPPVKHPDWGGPLVPWLKAAFHNALAWTLTDDARHRERALEALRLAAQACSQITRWTGHEHHEAWNAARAYDLLAVSGLDTADDTTFRTMLETLVVALDHADHRYCNNHNSMQMAGRMSLAAALGNRQYVHDVLYGCQSRQDWRYGLIHLLRHDFLADGMQWEGSPGYHMLVMMMVCECFTILENLGVDLWRREWPALRQDDGFDEHRGWGPKGMKTFAAALDALLYQAFTNGDYSLLHDQVLGNLRGTWVWWPIFNKAYAVYGEPRYAWALQHTNGGTPATTAGPVPPWFSGASGVAEFVRVETRDYPVGENPFAHDRSFSLTGRHLAGCSLFPMHGSALLRSDVIDESAIGAYLFWGPHWAGHHSPAALHLDIHALGRRATTAPHLYAGGYDDPRHLTWLRSTIAHNTVTVDEQSMFPYDFPTESLWECDHWRDTLSDGLLTCFQPEARFKAVRASNDDVYPGVNLDRTVVLTREYLLDAYRVTAERPRLLDWAMHVQGGFPAPTGAEPVDLGQNRGYRHFTVACRHPQRHGWVALPFTLDTGPGQALLWLDGAPDTQLILARDLDPDERRPIADAVAPQPRTCLIVRSRAAVALFVSIWCFGTRADDVAGGAIAGTADTDVTVTLRCGTQTHRWQLPRQGAVQML